jgi:hypothetical protein
MGFGAGLEAAEKKSLLPVLEIKPRFPDRPAYSLLTIAYRKGNNKVSPPLCGDPGSTPGYVVGLAVDKMALRQTPPTAI